jgi:hypothetical protein
MGLVRVVVRIMLRFKVLVSAIPFIAAAIFARIEFFSSPGPCVAFGSDNLQIASLPFHADLHVAFTDDPALATVRVALSNDAATADFAVIDDADGAEDGSCRTTPATQFIAISARPTSEAPVIYLSRDGGPADYRIFVRSKNFTDREAAALIVGAHDAS